MTTLICWLVGPSPVSQVIERRSSNQSTPGRCSGFVHTCLGYIVGYPGPRVCFGSRAIVLPVEFTIYRWNPQRFPDLLVPQGEEILEAFGSVFTVMEPRNFLDLLNLKFPRVFASMVECPKLHNIVSWLLNHQSLSIHTADVLVTFLVNHKLQELVEPDSPQTSLILRLFHLIFSALSKYHDLELVRI